MRRERHKQKGGGCTCRYLPQARLAARLFTLCVLLSPTAFATLLTLSDPASDTVGDGSLTPPTAEAFNRAPFDVRRVSVLEQPTLTLQLELASPLPEGATGPILELYLDSAPGGPTTLLPGSEMSVASGWETAFQIAGGQLRAFAPPSDNADALEPVNVTEALDARLTSEGSTLLITTSAPTPRRFSLYGLAGSYNPFSESGWRTLADAPSPWRFSSPSQTRPVVEVIADDPALQARAIQSGVLPEIRTSYRQFRWLFVAAAGLLVALIGFVLRLFSARSTPPPVTPEPDMTQPSTPVSVSPPVVSYGAREAGERAQILRSIDFETLEKGEWLEPLDERYQVLGRAGRMRRDDAGAGQSGGDQGVPKLGEVGD